MGRLAGFSADEVIHRLRRAGFIFDRQAKASREICWNPQSHAHTTVPHHLGDLPQGTLRAILRQAGLSIEEFLKTLSKKKLSSFV